MSTPEPPDPPERDDTTGRYSSETREKVYGGMPQNGEPMRASDVADDTGLPRTTVNYHLNKLHEDGRVNKKKFHEKRVVWWVDDDVDTGNSAGNDQAQPADD